MEDGMAVPAQLGELFTAGSDPAEFFAAVPEADVLHGLPDGVSVTFVLEGEGGGTWTVQRKGQQTEVTRAAHPYPDCRLACSVADFRALIRGELDPRQGFVERRLEVEGDVGLVLRLRRRVR
jgi:putative sterol carrier protein